MKKQADNRGEGAEWVGRGNREEWKKNLVGLLESQHIGLHVLQGCRTALSGFAPPEPTTVSDMEPIHTKGMLSKPGVLYEGFKNPHRVIRSVKNKC